MSSFVNSLKGLPTMKSIKLYMGKCMSPRRASFMLSYIWPIGLVVLSNVVYQICAKSIPSGINPFASLTITYVVAAIISLVLYHVTNKEGRLLEAYAQMNWAPFVLGIVIIGPFIGLCT